MFRRGKRKREDSLFSQVYDVKNLTDAWRKVRSNVRVKDRRHSQGVDLVWFARPLRGNTGNKNRRITSELPRSEAMLQYLGW